VAEDENMVADLSLTPWLENRLDAERERLVRLCSALTSHADVAEDLAQETLLEAWRHLHTLREPERFAAWLSGIARNVCLRWMRAQHRHAIPCIPLNIGDVEPAYDHDLAHHLEQRDLVDLLNRTLAQLPPAMRKLLLAHYIEGRSLRDLAVLQQESEAALAKRLQRSKFALKRALANEHEPSWEAHLSQSISGLWEATNIWCPFCGSHTWQAQHQRGIFHFGCPHCHQSSPAEITTHDSWNTRGYKRILWKMMTWVEQTYRPYLSAPARPCPSCGRVVPLQRTKHTLLLRCPWCHTINQNTLPLLALGCVEGRTFWRNHLQVQMQPIRESEYKRRRAWEITYHAVTSRAAFTVLFAADTFEILAAQQS
jgi:RNA polymerase sigma factor (sigma-70 family)